MPSFLRHIFQLRSYIEASRVWAFVTKTVLRLIISILVVFSALLAIMVSSVFIFVISPLFGVIACAVLCVLILILHLLVDEARRRENGQ